MPSSRRVPFAQLETADLHLDAVYVGGSAKNMSDDPIGKLIPGVGNQGGFRQCGSSDLSMCRYVVLYSSGVDPDWPDNLDVMSGQFLYFGDNKKPGHELHETSRGGNRLLRDAFQALHANDRDQIPPFLIFTKGAIGREVVFRGLAVPGAEGLAATEDLVAIWKSKSGNRFQNYRAVFTILDVPIVPRCWLNDLRNGISCSEDAPDVWRDWVERGICMPLRADRTIQHRTKDEQLPSDKTSRQIVEAIRVHFADHPHGFEKCAAEVFRMSDRNVASCDVTRPWRDGGRDALGKYRIGQAENAIEVDFALEAKCYATTNSVGVRETSRLISRLRHRQFGVLVTTSYVHNQAYREIKEDGHPIIVIASRDIAGILQSAGIRDEGATKQWLKDRFPLDD